MFSLSESLRNTCVYSVVVRPSILINVCVAPCLSIIRFLIVLPSSLSTDPFLSSSLILSLLSICLSSFVRAFCSLVIESQLNSAFRLSGSIVGRVFRCSRPQLCSHSHPSMSSSVVCPCLWASVQFQVSVRFQVSVHSRFPAQQLY